MFAWNLFIYRRYCWERKVLAINPNLCDICPRVVCLRHSSSEHKRGSASINILEFWHSFGFLWASALSLLLLQIQTHRTLARMPSRNTSSANSFRVRPRFSFSTSTSAFRSWQSLHARTLQCHCFQFVNLWRPGKLSVGSVRITNTRWGKQKWSFFCIQVQNVLKNDLSFRTHVVCCWIHIFLNAHLMKRSFHKVTTIIFLYSVFKF